MNPEGITIVEPEGTIRLMYEHSLQGLGWRVQSFERLSEAISERQVSNCRLLMAHIDVGSTRDHEHLLRWMGRHPSIPVVMILSNPLASDVREAFRGGATDVLIQPHGPAELVSCVRSAMSRQGRRAVSSGEDRFEVASRIASGLAHHLNNLLERIVGRTSLSLKRENLPADIEADLHEIMEAGLDSASFVRRMSHFANVPEYQGAVIHPGPALPEIVGRWERRRQARVRLNLQVDPEVGMIGDRTLLGELLDELLTNALEASPPGQMVTASAYLEREADACRLIIEIEDEGPGLTRWQLAHVFEPFFSTKSPPGRGLGLVVARGITQSFGGTLDIGNRIPHGAVATLRLPVVRIHSDASASAEEPEYAAGRVEIAVPPPSSAPAVAGRVVVVDDEPLVLRMISRMVARVTDLPVTSVASGREAIAMASRAGHEISLLVLDVCLRDESGLNVYRDIRRLEPELPVLLVSGFTSNSELPQVLAQDEKTRFLPKPFEMEQLRRATNLLLRAE